MNKNNGYHCHSIIYSRKIVPLRLRHEETWQLWGRHCCNFQKSQSIRFVSSKLKLFTPMPCGSDNCYWSTDTNNCYWSTDTRFKKEAERLYNSNHFNYFNYFDPFMYNVGKRHTTRFLKTIWPFFYIMHEGISYFHYYSTPKLIWQRLKTVGSSNVFTIRKTTWLWK